MSSRWRCDRHGDIVPLERASAPHSTLVHAIAAESPLPVWLPWPLPQGWLITGITRAADDRSGTQAVVVACGGPAPLGGYAELVVVSERPGIGAGAGFADLPHADPDTAMWSGPSTAKVDARGRPTALWSVAVATDRAAFVGEAEGNWLWMVLWPADAGHLLADDIRLVDVRDEVAGFDLPCGAVSTRIPRA